MKWSNTQKRWVRSVRYSVGLDAVPLICIAEYESDDYWDDRDLPQDARYLPPGTGHIYKSLSLNPPDHMHRIV